MAVLQSLLSLLDKTKKINKILYLWHILHRVTHFLSEKSVRYKPHNTAHSNQAYNHTKPPYSIVLPTLVLGIDNASQILHSVGDTL